MPLEVFSGIGQSSHMNPASTECAGAMKLPVRLNIGRHRLAASLFFLADGMVFSTWATLIPTLKSRFGLSEAMLGVVLLGMVIVLLFSAFIVLRGRAFLEPR